MSEDALADVLNNLTEALLPLDGHLLTFAAVIGFVLVGTGLLRLARSRGLSTGTGAAIIQIVLGFPLFGCKAFIAAASVTLFEEEASLSSQLGLLQRTDLFRPYIRFAVTCVILLGIVSIIRGLLRLRDASLGASQGVALGLTHLLAGLVCVNIVTFARIFAATAGGIVEQIITKIFS